jgi:hypothetical protein
MSAEDHLTGTPEGRPADQGVAHSYFVGRRASHTAEVYEVTATSVERLRSTRRSGEESLDWRGSHVVRMELSRLLIRRVLNQRPSRDLQARFALYVLGRLPAGGFVLESDDLARWLRIAGDDDAPATGSARPRSWLGRRLSDPRR